MKMYQKWQCKKIRARDEHLGFGRMEALQAAFASQYPLRYLAQTQLQAWEAEIMH
jgi:hypothetical protein